MFSRGRISQSIKLFKECKRWKSRSVQIPLGNGVLEVVAGDAAQFADGSATVKINDTEVLGTLVSKEEPSQSHFLPLTVDYIYPLTMFDVNILCGRMIDRSLRPMFFKDYRYDTQVMCTVQSRNTSLDPLVASINAASAATAMSNVPFRGPIGAVQVGMIGEKVIINPSKEALETSRLNMFISANEEGKIVMIDGAANILPLPLVEKAIEEGVANAQKIACLIKKFSDEFGKPKRTLVPLPSLSDELKAKIDEIASSEVEEDYKRLYDDKMAREKARRAVKVKVLDLLKETHPGCDAGLVSAHLDQLGAKMFRKITMTTGRRWAEVRGDNDIRILSHKVGLNSSLHGSSIFQRGGTQVRATLSFEPPHYTYNTPFPLSGTNKTNFCLDYRFPAYATNETKSMTFGRREVGHGALASKGLRPIIPPSYDFGIRINSVVQQSSGSSSMASVCAGSLALQDAGVPILEPVSGVAMGLMTHEDEQTGEIKAIILTDISGVEDALGDMDFKIAGTKRGVTAMQLDTKLPGMSMDLILQAIRQGQVANSNIIDDMSKTISKPAEQKDNRPMTESLVVPMSKRAKFLGINRSNVKAISEETGVTIASIDDSTCEYQIFAPNRTSMAKALELIKNVLEKDNTPQYEKGSICKVKIVELKDGGIFVQLHPTLPEIYIPNMLLDRRKGVTPAMMGYKEGKEITVKYHGEDPQTGKIRLSKRDLEPSYI